MKEFLKFIGGSLFSNPNVLEGKRRKFYQALIIGLISLIIAIVPIFSFTMSIEGSQVITKQDNSSLDTSLTMFSKYLSENDEASVTINAQGKIKVEGITEYVISSSEGRHLLSVRYATDEEDPNEIANHYTNGIVDGKPTDTPRSFIILQSNSIYICTFALNAKNTLNEDGTIKNKANYTSTYTGEPKELKGTDFATYYTSEIGGAEACVEKWKSALDKMYTPIKTSTVLYSVSIYSLLNFIIMLTMSVIIMILTRLKSAQCEKMRFVESLKCVFFASLSPAIISLLIGFMISSFASVAFVMCIGIRCVFLGSKASQSSKY